MRSLGRVIVAGVLAAGVSFSGLSVVSAAEKNPSDRLAVSYEEDQVEEINDEQREQLNLLLEGFGYAPVPDEVVRFEERGDQVVAFDDSGNEVAIDAERTVPRIQARNAVTDEIKRAVGACLGIDFFAEVGAWEAIESQITDWNKAAKFVLRRVGLIAALSCGGGIFYEYLIK